MNRDHVFLVQSFSSNPPAELNPTGWRKPVHTTHGLFFSKGARVVLAQLRSARILDLLKIVLALDGVAQQFAWSFQVEDADHVLAMGFNRGFADEQLIGDFLVCLAYRNQL